MNRSKDVASIIISSVKNCYINNFCKFVKLISRPTPNAFKYSPYCMQRFTFHSFIRNWNFFFPLSCSQAYWKLMKTMLHTSILGQILQSDLEDTECPWTKLSKHHRNAQTERLTMSTVHQIFFRFLECVTICEHYISYTVFHTTILLEVQIIEYRIQILGWKRIDDMIDG